ncbi:MAG: ATP-dependent DNA helicase [Chromatocurvus sp.]
MPDIRVSVRELAGFCHRVGDLDARFGPGPTAQEGIRGHRELAAARGEGYLAEYALETTYRRGDLTLLLRGRADGYLPSVPMIEEIKTCRTDPARLPSDLSRLHLAQARLYAAMLAAAEGLAEVQVRLTWYDLNRREEHPLDQAYSAAELAEFLESACERYARWMTERLQHAAGRDVSIRALAFPFRDYRQGQRDVAELVYKCIHSGGQLMLEAPTGLGKTAAVLYPAIKGLAHDCHDHVVFCTAKHTGRDAAQDTLACFAAQGLIATTLTLTAKERICFSPGHACRADDCHYARGYYDRLPAARKDALQRRALTQAEVESVAREHVLCPYQLGLDLLPWVDIAIADQHHVFSLHAAVAALAAQSASRWTVLVDEAHNLPARARGMYSATLSGDFAAANRVLRGAPRRALAALDTALQTLFLAHIKPQADYAVLPLPPTALLAHMQAVITAIAEQLAQPGAPPRPPPDVQALYFALLHFVRLSDLAADDFCCELLAQEGNSLRLNCIDPARLLAQRHAALHAVVAFSATLSPAAWMRVLLGLGDRAVFRRCASPFEPRQLGVSIEPQIDTRLPQRERSRPRLLARLVEWLAAQPGNCLVFFPSHRYLRDCIEDLRPLLRDRQLWVQPAPGSGAPPGELRELLRTQRNVCALCLLGGSYSEGIDLPGDQLRSVVLVGPGLPQPDRDNRLQRDYFQRHHGDGFRYASLYPAMQRVNQSLGRVVRGDTDCGAALLIDGRYAQPEYRALLSGHWEYRVLGD